MTCTLSVSIPKTYSDAPALLQQLAEGFDAPLRINRWRSVATWTLLAVLRRDAHDGRVQVDVFLVLKRQRAGRCDNVFAAWRNVVVRQLMPNAPSIVDAQRGAWQDLEAFRVHMDARPQATPYEVVVREILARSSGLAKYISDELTPPRQLAGAVASAAVTQAPAPA